MFLVPKSAKVDEQEQKKSVDDLWADFMKDTGFKPKNSKPTTSSNTSTPSKSSSSADKLIASPDKKEVKSATKVKVTQIFEFAGEEVKVEKEVR